MTSSKYQSLRRKRSEAGPIAGRDEHTADDVTRGNP